MLAGAGCFPGFPGLLSVCFLVRTSPDLHHTSLNFEIFCVRYYRGRGAFESMGAGLPMAPGDIAFKSNFATLNVETGIVEKRRADRQFEHLGPTLCDALDGGFTPPLLCHSTN